jgi:riboflavin kinase/FMN adenylyltransferase
MRIYGSLDALPDPPLEPVATMGNFDGLHRGHQALLGRLQEEAKRLGAETMVITFYPHPRNVLKPEEPVPLLMSLKERVRRLYQLGIDHTLVLPFDEDLAEMTHKEFVDGVFWDKLRIQGMVVGPNMRFGHQRLGDVAFLQSEGRRLGFGVGLFDPIMAGSRRISSSGIRDAIGRGDLETAAHLLGRYHRVVGMVVQGDQRGRELGFPTANLDSDGGMLPPFGVYAGWAEEVDAPGTWPAVVNIGVRPTVDDSGLLKIEAHLLGFEGDLYGKTMALGLVQRIRAELAFDSVAELGRQIKRDAIEAKRILGVARR